MGMEDRVLIIGPGAIGTLMGYTFYKSGYHVDYIHRDISKKGLKCTMYKVEGGDFLSNIYRWGEIDTLSNYKYIVLATKAYDAPSAINKLLEIYPGGKLIITLQNGIGTYEYIVERVDPRFVIPMVLTYGAIKLDVCKARLGGVGQVYLGSSYVNKEVLEMLRMDLELGGVNAKIVNNIEGYRWLKTLVNAGINPVTSIFDAPNKIIIENRGAWELAKSVVEEGIEVVDKMGVKLPEDPIDAMKTIARETGENISSMLQDIRGGRKTEIDYINGAIIRYGKKYGVKTPINELLVRLIRRLSK